MSITIYSPKDGYNLIAPYYDSWVWQEFWRKNEYYYIKRWCENLRPNLHGLDIGTGSGNNLYCFLEKGHSVDAIDISSRMIDYCKTKHKIYNDAGILKCTVEDAVNIVRCGRIYDWIISNRVFSHIFDIHRVVSRVRETIKFNGEFFFSDIHPLHHYEYTNYNIGKSQDIKITTYKHKIDEIERTFIEYGFERIMFKQFSRNGIIDGESVKKIPSLSRQDPDVPIFYYFIFRFKG